MASKSTQTTSTSDEQTPTFLSLPAEIRLKIYKFLYQEIEIHCGYTYRHWGQDDDVVAKLRGQIYWYSFRYCSALLFASRQIYSEAKPVVNAAPITVSGRERGRFEQSDVPDAWNVCSRISKLIIPDDAFATSNWSRGYWDSDVSPFRFGFFEPGQCPNLQTVSVRKVNGQERPYSKELNNITYPIAMLPTIHACLACQVEPAGYQSICKLRQTLKSFWGGKHPNASRQEEIDMNDTLVTERHIALKSAYHFALRDVQDVGDPVAEWQAFEKWFEVIIIWDKNGMRIEELPNLKDMWWWKKWSKYCFPKAGPSKDDNDLRFKVFWADSHDGLNTQWFSSEDLDMTQAML